MLCRFKLFICEIQNKNAYIFVLQFFITALHFIFLVVATSGGE